MYFTKYNFFFSNTLLHTNTRPQTHFIYTHVFFKLLPLFNTLIVYTASKLNLCNLTTTKTKITPFTQLTRHECKYTNINRLNQKQKKILQSRGCGYIGIASGKASTDNARSLFNTATTTSSIK